MSCQDVPILSDYTELDTNGLSFLISRAVARGLKVSTNFAASKLCYNTAPFKLERDRQGLLEIFKVRVSYAWEVGENYRGGGYYQLYHNEIFKVRLITRGFN
mmetsp:Transcript_8744/g.13475  ORF Transcript_8744/g.13475 Transcript_8744/m.13475 type:complete len:102 (-) Transcript_8744:675-980(-)